VFRNSPFQPLLRIARPFKDFALHRAVLPPCPVIQIRSEQSGIIRIGVFDGQQQFAEFIGNNIDKFGHEGGRLLLVYKDF